MTRVEEAIRAARASKRPALSAFVTAGFPDRASFPALLDDVASVADLIEIGVPFSDPMADGVTIQRSSFAALQAGVTLDWILSVVAAARTKTPIILMSYLNPLLAMGIERLVSRSAEAGVAGFIVPDLPFEECAPLRNACDDAGIALIQLVAPATPHERRRLLCDESRGFVYAVTRNGTTGTGAAIDAQVREFLQDVRRRSSLPVLAGFGVRDAAGFRAVSEHADGAIVGSALIETLERGEDPVAFLKGLTDSRGMDR